MMGKLLTPSVSSLRFFNGFVKVEEIRDLCWDMKHREVAFDYKNCRSKYYTIFEEKISSRKYTAGLEKSGPALCKKTRLSDNRKRESEIR